MITPISMNEKKPIHTANEFPKNWDSFLLCIYLTNGF